MITKLLLQQLHTYFTIPCPIATQAFAAANVCSMRRWHARRAFCWWRGLVEARMLIGRVLWKAQELWEIAGSIELAYSSEFQSLKQVRAWDLMHLGIREQRHLICAAC